jgi:hypothetical protein
MRFHVRGHKSHPPHANESFKFTLKKRLLLAAFGALFVFGGYFKIVHGTWAYFNWFDQPVYSTSLIATGAFILLPALLPSSWIDNLVKRIAS